MSALTALCVPGDRVLVHTPAYIGFSHSLKAAGYDYLSLGCIEANEEARKFWEGQGFRATGEEQQSDYKVILMGRDI